MITVALLGLVVAHRRGHVALAALAVLGGALTKETTLVLAPLVIITLELDQRAPPRWRLFAAEGAALAAALGLRLAFAPAFRAQPLDLGVNAALGTRLSSALAKSAGRMLLPLDPSLCDAFAVTGLFSVGALVGALVLGGVALLAWRRRGLALLLALGLGVAQLEQHRFADASAAFRAALALVTEPSTRRRLTHNLATAELRAGHAEEAAHLLEPEAARPDALPESLFERARALHQLGREDEAGALVRRLQAQGGVTALERTPG
jgi:hypothetical protein